MKTGDYLRKLKLRAIKSKVYKRYQLTGLEIAKMLSDEKHKSLYIKLAKNGDPEKLLRLAKEVIEKRGVINKGAYFMTALMKTEKINTVPPAQKKSAI